MKRSVIISLSAAIVLAFVAVELLTPTTLDRRPSFEHDAAVPYGAQILYEILPELLEGAELRVNSRSTFLHLRDTSRSGENYLILTTSFLADSLLSHQLLDYAARGNTVLVAAENFFGPMADSLGIATRWVRVDPRARAVPQDSVLHLAAPHLRRDGGYRFHERLARHHLDVADTSRTTILGFVESDEEPLANFVRIEVGEGQVLILATPLALTNYHLLAGDGAAYAAAALAYLPAQSTVWDGIHKPLRRSADSPLRFIHETPPLAFSYYTLLMGALMFVLFRGRRWQRPIPVVEPPRNQTVAFARAVARLWHEHGGDRQLAQRRLHHLRQRLRTALSEPELELSAGYRDQIVRRLALPEADLDAVLAFAGRLHEDRRLEPRALIELDRRLDSIYQHLP